MKLCQVTCRMDFTAKFSKGLTGLKSSETCRSDTSRTQMSRAIDPLATGTQDNKNNIMLFVSFLISSFTASLLNELLPLRSRGPLNPKYTTVNTSQARSIARVIIVSYRGWRGLLLAAWHRMRWTQIAEGCLVPGVRRLWGKRWIAALGAPGDRKQWCNYRIWHLKHPPLF